MEQSKAESIASRLKAAWNAHDVKEFEDLSPVLVAVHSDENECMRLANRIYQKLSKFAMISEWMEMN